MNFYDRPQTLLEDRQHGALRSVHPNKRVSISNWRRGWLVFRKPLVIALLISLPSGVYAAAERRVQIGFASFTSTNAPLWVAADRGFFAQEGLDPELIFIGSGPTMVASMIAREVPLALIAGTTVVSAVAGGAPLKILATFSNRLSSDLIARPGITRPEDLRGKRVGVQSMGGGIWMQALLALERLGLEPVRDRLHIQVIGPQPQLAKALETGAIDVTVLPTAFSQPLKARGYPVLLSFLNANIPLTLSGLIALKETVEQSPQLVERALKGLLRALAFVHYPSNREAVTRWLGASGWNNGMPRKPIGWLWRRSSESRTRQVKGS
jgi:NitT/TauT family transport system substrate-binding protein